jgi:hypothetical protein
MRRHRYSLLLLPFCLLTTSAACTRERPSSPGATVRDSAGITIVENSAPLWPDGHRWRLSDTPILQIGALEAAPEYQFFRALDAVRLQDGRIVVANAGSHELRFYDAAGTYLTSTGREGSGPAEFKNLSWLQRFSRDSLATWDRGNTRISVFDADGRFARSFRLETGGENAAFPQPMLFFNDRSLLAMGMRPVTPGVSNSGVSRDSIAFLRHGSDGELIDTIGRFPGLELYLKSWEEGAAVIPRPFGRNPRLAAWGDGFYYGSSDTFELGFYTADGSLRHLIRKAQSNIAVTPEDVERYKHDRLESAGSEGFRQQLRDMFKDLPFPETMPAYSTFKVDSEGNLWVAEYQRPGDEQPRWSVFDPEGRWLGMVETPQRFSVEQIGSDFVLGFSRDEMDVEYVYLYQLVKEPDAR